MSACEAADRRTTEATMGFFKRVGLGPGFPAVFQSIGAMEIAKVNMPMGLPTKQTMT